MNKNLLQKVVFLDRDGVINRDSPDYVKSWTEFHFLPRSKTALKNLVQNGFVTIVITNQSAINRKMISKEELEFIHRQMRNEIVDFGGEIKDIFYCPHLPEDGCECRKPKPGLIYQAHREYCIDIPTSVMVGDNAKDIECFFFFILGLRGETRESALRTIRYALKLNPAFLQFTVATPYPGTALRAWAERNNFIENEALSALTGHETAMRNEHMTSEKIRQLQWLAQEAREMTGKRIATRFAGSVFRLGYELKRWMIFQKAKMHEGL